MMMMMMMTTTTMIIRSGNNTTKAFYRFSIQISCTKDIAHNKESATIWNLKPDWWGAPIIQEEKYQGKGNLRQEMVIMMIMFQFVSMDKYHKGYSTENVRCYLHTQVYIFSSAWRLDHPPRKKKVFHPCINSFYTIISAPFDIWEELPL
jgi:hypothetical protein